MRPPARLVNGRVRDTDVDGRLSGVTELLDGAIDLHVHPSPSPFPRRISILEAAVEAAEVGFSTIAVKSHHHSMITDVLAVEAAVGKLPLEVLSGVCLNNEVGGLNPYAVELALSQEGRIVWFPTLAAQRHLEFGDSLRTFPVSRVPLRAQAPVRVFDDSGRPLDAALEILAMIRDADAVLSCGHLAATEIDQLIRTAQAVGVRRILVNHPNFIVEASPAQCAEWAARGVYVEHSLCHYMDGSALRRWGLDTLLDYAEKVGAEQTILSSDLGQVGNPTPVEGFRWVVTELGAAGVPEATIRQLVGGSARTLIS
jgi:hypothetical protein